jgi:transposase-like protein
MEHDLTSLQEAIVYFSNPDNCLNYLAARRWPDGPECPNCGRKDVRFLTKRRVWECKTRHPKHQFSVKVGTIFEDSPIPLDKWLTAVWMLCNCKNGVSSYEIARDLDVTQKSAWFMMHRIRRALQSGSFRKLSGEVEVDESFIGGKARNMHASRRARVITGTGGKDKAMVLGMVERSGQVRTLVVENRRKTALQSMVREHVEAGTAIFTDELKSYDGLDSEYTHAVINHAVEYANGNVHTNTMENFWALLKRGLHGTYVSVEPFHLFRYLDEQSFRYNNRKATDAERFNTALRQIVGRRLTYEELTGNAEWRLGQPPA